MRALASTGDWQGLRALLHEELGVGHWAAESISLQEVSEVLSRLGLPLDENRLNATVQTLDTRSNFTVEPALLLTAIEEALLQAHS